jgi:four helix bundle protein
MGWQKGVELVTNVDRLTQDFPRTEIYGLTNQMRRAAVSIPSNIAEGQGRLSKGGFKQFLGHARGSVFELESQVLIARNLEYLNAENATCLLQQIDELGRILNGLLKSLDRGPQLTTSH